VTETGSAGPPAAHDSDGHRGLPGRLLAAARGAGWGFADQALSSATNFALGVIVARAMGPADFGAFSLVFAVFLFALNVSRALTSLPLSIRFSGVADADWRWGTGRAAGLAVLSGIAVAVICVAAGLVAGGALEEGFLAMAVVLPGLMLQDLWRFAFFARADGRAAFLNDLVWTILQLPVFAWLVVAGTLSVGVPILAWGLSALGAALFGIWQAGSGVRVRGIGEWWRSQQDVAPRFAGEQLASRSGDVVRPYAITAVAGLSVVGAIRASQLLLGPFNVVLQGATIVALPSGARMLRQSAAELRRLAILLTLGLAGVALALGLPVLLLPDDLGRLVLGANWDVARPILPATIAWVVATGASTGPTVGIRVLAAVHRSFKTRLLLTVIGVVAATLGAAWGGAVGSATALALATWLGTIAWWWQFLAALGEYEPDAGEALEVGRRAPAASFARPVPGVTGGSGPDGADGG
jgi:O-antigen/teichoic acid export membrane protein